jgi:hypothetical protein
MLTIDCAAALETTAMVRLTAMKSGRAIENLNMLGGGFFLMGLWRDGDPTANFQQWFCE